jgi:hypothetical protein
VQFAMLYESFLQERPANWKKVGELRLGKKNMTLGHNAVAFYALNTAAYHTLKTLLHNFQQQLPEGVKITLIQ